MESIFNPATLGALAAVVTGLGVILARFYEISKLRQAAVQKDLDSMREEIGRLRDDLAQRDSTASKNHEELTGLRTQVGDLQLQVLELMQGVHVLTQQLTEHKITPKFEVPSGN